MDSMKTQVFWRIVMETGKRKEKAQHASRQSFASVRHAT
jgi:hypothetical protein